jgi:hypothetical protein
MGLEGVQGRVFNDSRDGLHSAKCTGNHLRPRWLLFVSGCLRGHVQFHTHLRWRSRLRSRCYRHRRRRHRRHRRCCRPIQPLRRSHRRSRHRRCRCLPRPRCRHHRCRLQRKPVAEIQVHGAQYTVRKRARRTLYAACVAGAYHYSSLRVSAQCSASGGGWWPEAQRLRGALRCRTALRTI